MPSPRPPLQIIVFSDPDHEDSKSYDTMIAAVIRGGRDSVGYVPTVDDLGIQLTFYTPTSAPPTPAPALLPACLHTLVVVIVSDGFVQKASPAVWDWLTECWTTIAATGEAHGVLPVAFDERSACDFIARDPVLGSRQLLLAAAFGETALRPPLLALRVLHEARLLLAPSSGAGRLQPKGYLRLFISHAKLDGLPLARALKHILAEIPWLTTFYDADDLPAGSDWKQELEKGVGESVIVMLRTENYDLRHWCQQEVLWSEEYATPALLVEARTGLNHPAGILPFDRAPVVRIPDGNLLRVIFLAIREGLRFLYFAAKIEEMKSSGLIPTHATLRIFCSPPSMPALLRACGALAKPPTSSGFIIYPDPPLRAGVKEAAEALVDKYGGGAQLATPLTLLVKHASATP